MIPLILGIAMASIWWIRRLRTNRVDPTRDLAQVTASLARELRQGAGLHQTVLRIGDEAPATLAGLSAVASALRGGVDLQSALNAWSARPEGVDSAGRSAKVRQPNAGDVELLVGALAMGSSFGGDLAAALDAVGAALMARADLADETSALTSQANASMVMMCSLPLLGSALFASVDRRAGAILFQTTAGRLCLLIGLTLEMAAVGVSRVMVYRALR